MADNKGVVVEVLTDLRMFEINCAHLYRLHTCTRLVESVRRVKESLAAAEWRDASISEHPRLSDVSIEVTPSSARWRGRLDPSAVRGKHKVTVVWYMIETTPESTRQEGGRLWRVVHGLSQTTDLASLKPSADGTVEYVIPYLAQQNQCLAEGAYVPEIYIDGGLVSPPDLKPVPVKHYETFRSRYLNLSMCHPAGWKMLLGDWHIPMRLFKDEQDRNMVLVYTFYGPRTGSPDEVKSEYATRALDFLFGILPKAPSAQDRRNALDNMAAFHGCDGTASPGAVPHREWVTPEGFVHVVLVYPQVPIGDACEILNSIYNYFDPNDPRAKK